MATDFDEIGAMETYLRGPVFNAINAKLYNKVPSDLPVAVHQVSPVNVIEKSDFIREVYGWSNYATKFAEGSSLISLPTDREDAFRARLSQHLGSHPGYWGGLARIHSGLKTRFDTDFPPLVLLYRRAGRF